MDTDNELDEAAADFRNLPQEIRTANPVIPAAVAKAGPRQATKVEIFLAVAILAGVLVIVYIFIHRQPVRKNPYPKNSLPTVQVQSK